MGASGDGAAVRWGQIPPIRQDARRPARPNAPTPKTPTPACLAAGALPFLARLADLVSGAYIQCMVEMAEDSRLRHERPRRRRAECGQQFSPSDATLSDGLGYSQGRAYKAAGYLASNTNSADAAASRLLRNVKPISDRVLELVAEANARNQHTIDLPRERIGRDLDLASRMAAE